MFVYVTLQRRRFPLFADLLYVAVLLMLTVLGSIGESHPSHDPFPASAVAPWPAYLLVAAGSVALFWRYRRPVAALTVTLVCTLTYTAFGYENGAALLNPMCALYTVVVTAWRPTTPGGSVRAVRTALIATGVTFTTLAVATAAHNPFGAIGGSFVLIPGEVALAFFAGLAVANQRAYVDAIRQRAEDAERGREDEARRRVDAERLRIARELHDVVAHTMSTINLQAGVAVHVSRDSPDLPEPVAAALGTIRDASKNGLRELRAILAVLRQVDDAESSAPTAPTPDLDGLPALLDTVRASGLPVSVEITGERRRLPAAVELAAYRIVQESLTNTLRHAGPATATVRIRYGDEELDVRVTDDGVGAENTGSETLHGSGHGLIGMRERALATGGTLQAHPGPAGGFLVRARLPLGKETA
ncbi:sensor histidine kinase [Catenulispora sp. EB89]|uniref:sensor histidine kinase n=1 Tax=Catenulispora sp. EB89 TaxID=3156257 RepID=UPI0035188669